jgi:3-oxoadipate enol-lactonase
MPFCDANGVELYYEVSGTGPRLLFISGTGADLRRQPRLTDGPHFSQFELLQFDQRGLGRSEVPDGPYTMADYGNDAAALLDVLGWRDALVLGVSFGGMVAQELAIRHPARVRRLVLACTSAGGAGGASYPLHELADLAPEESLALRFQLLDTRWDAPWREANPEMVRMISEGFQLARSGDPDADGPRLQLEARRHHDTARRLDQIRCATLVCGGRYDGIAPPANSEFLAGAIPGARLEFFDGGHIFFMQDVSAFPSMTAFLLGTEAPRPLPDGGQADGAVSAPGA